MPEGRTPIGRDIVHALRLTREIEEREGRDAVPGPIRLRAARAAWLIGDVDAARDAYRRAAVRLLDEARTIGRPSFTFCAIAEHAMGAAYMSNDRQVRRDVLGDVVTVAEAADPPARYAAMSQTREADPLIRCAYATTKIRSHWYQGQLRELKTPADPRSQDELFRRTGETQGWIPRLLRNAGLLEGAARDLWLSSRGPRTIAALRAAVEAAQRDLEEALVHPETGLLRWLQANAAQPPTVMDIVDEELISICDHATRLRMRLPPQIPPTVQPGALASHVA